MKLMTKLFSSKEFNLDYSLVTTFEECLEECILNSETPLDINVQDLVKTKNVQNIKIIGKALASFLDKYK